MLSIRDLNLTIRTSRQGTRSLRDWSCDLPAGNLHALVGPSGLGKTSLAIALIGAPRANVSVASGSVRLDGVDLLALSASRLRALWGADILHVPQSSATALVPTVAVVDQLLDVRHGGERPAVQRDRLRAAFDALEIPGFDEHRLPHHYSGGQLQRALLTRLFVTRPRLVVLDEPTTALHPELKAAVMDVVRRRVTEVGAVCLVVSHEFARFASTGDGVVDVEALLGAQPSAARLPLTPSGDRFVAKTPPHPTRSGPGLSVRDLTVLTGGRKPIIEEVSLDVPRAGCVGIIGRSGAGKTTLLRAIFGLHRHVTGDIRVQGRQLRPDFRRRSPGERRLVEFVPQSVKLHLNPLLTAEFLIRRRLAAAGRPTSSEDVASRLHAVGLGMEDALKTPAELSGGECQRLGIALALAAAPAVILLDEVTASLDEETRSVIGAALAGARRTNDVAFLLVSHQPKLIADLADTVLVMEEGRIVEEATGRLPAWFADGVVTEELQPAASR